MLRLGVKLLTRTTCFSVHDGITTQLILQNNAILEGGYLGCV